MERDEVPRRALARDTIAAIATPHGRGGIGIVRLSGPEVVRLAQEILGFLPKPRLAMLGTFKDAHGQPVDQGVALYFPAPNSYTGEDVLELHGHGGPAVLQGVLAACLDRGARIAEPGEFTRRAFLQGKLDLAQAEAIADLIDAASREASRSALRSLSGDFSAAVLRVVEELTELRALTEAMLDFPEEEVEAIHRNDAMVRLAKIHAALADLMARSRQGRLLSAGLHIVIAGRPNVGKSSLLNRLSGEERAIVTPVPGTTRDVLREPFEIEGLPVVLVDTAGFRARSDDAIERIGMERARSEVARADVVLVVRDARAPEDAPGDLPGEGARLDVYNKVDLAPGFGAPAGGVAVSAMTGEGMEGLRRAIVRAAGWTHAGETVFLARERHLRAMALAETRINAARERGREWELFAEELRLAQDALGEITGAVTPDDLLGEIFGRFCIGK